MVVELSGTASKLTIFCADSFVCLLASLDMVHTFVMLAGGCCAGILGCTGFNGAILYVLLYMSMQLCLLVTMGFDSQKYMLVSPVQFLVGGIGEHALSFILFWTLVYALVYIY